MSHEGCIHVLAGPVRTIHEIFPTREGLKRILRMMTSWRSGSRSSISNRWWLLTWRLRRSVADCVWPGSVLDGSGPGGISSVCGIRVPSGSGLTSYNLSLYNPRIFAFLRHSTARQCMGGTATYVLYTLFAISPYTTARYHSTSKYGGTVYFCTIIAPFLLSCLRV